MRLRKALYCRGWAPYTIGTGVSVIALLLAADVVAASEDPTAPAGLVQRLTIAVGWGWIALLAIRLLSDGQPADG